MYVYTTISYVYMKSVKAKNVITLFVILGQTWYLTNLYEFTFYKTLLKYLNC